MEENMSREKKGHRDASYCVVQNSVTGKRLGHAFSMAGGFRVAALLITRYRSAEISRSESVAM